ncbi:tumor protein D52 isoform X2 [Cephus cinctus]|uniref:Tumor protein D52 isoform X2 n=1 Tax=Cephus cinctus TaxID=211228 RepID=A0AAJ7BK66_CEPCN|nr:tumor protein D52 isoform X2 [Cephus cinctus]
MRGKMSATTEKSGTCSETDNCAESRPSADDRLAPLHKKVCEEHGDDCPSENEHEFESLEYEEDVYYSHLAATPSFDDIDELSDSDEIVVHCWRDSNGDIEEIVVDDANLSVETEFLERSDTEKRKKRSVRVIFQDLSKPYLARISNSQNYKKFLELVKGEDASLQTDGTPSPSTDKNVYGVHVLSAEEERQKAEWIAELTQVEEEIQTLRHVLANKVKVSQELKRKLGISVWKELTDDVNQGLRNVKESQVFQKTETALKSTAEKTTSILGGFGSGLSMKLGQMRNSESFRSLEERVGSAYENVKTKVVPSRSNSTQSFDEALREAEATRRASAAPSATSPTIPEDKLLS